MPSSDEIAALKTQIAAKDALIAILEEKLRLAASQQFGPTSEKLAALGQYDLFFNEAEALGAKPEDETQASETIVPEHTRPRGKRKPIDANLPRKRIEYDIPEAEKTCTCGCQLTRIGEVTSEQLDIEPAKACVLQHVRFKYACRSCEGTSHDGPAVVTAAMPAQPLPKTNASPGLAAFITVSKYADGLPLYRLEGILNRYMISVSRTAMACWMIKLGDLVTPLINLFNDIQLGYDVLQMDETTVQVLKEDGRAAKGKDVSDRGIGLVEAQDPEEHERVRERLARRSRDHVEVRARSSCFGHPDEEQLEEQREHRPERGREERAPVRDGHARLALEEGRLRRRRRDGAVAG